MSLQGDCPQPFFQETQFPATGGFIPGRLCQPIHTLVGNVSCCLPCPSTDWTYSDGFAKRTEIANWINVAALAITCLLLLSFIFLPVKWTNRHYLSIGLALGVGCIEVAFLIPLAAKPEQCHNKITPNDMYSDLTCAFSGAFLLFGGWATVMWVFLRALSLHLQICWEVIPGKKFFYSALSLGWIIPAVGLALALSLTGVSYRFGNVCHINHKDSIEDFWGPLLAFSAAALVLQFFTLGYCTRVYLKNLADDKPTTDTSSNLPSHTSSVRTAQTARVAYRRVRKVISLQWRGITIVLFVICDVIFFSVVFVTMDNSSQVNAARTQKVLPWATCLVLSGGQKNECLPKARDLVEKEPVVLAVLVMLGIIGFWNLLFLGRWSMVLGWIDLCKRHLMYRHEFVSADARRLSNDPHAAVMSPLSSHSAPFSPEDDSRNDYFGRSTKAYFSPVQSFSTPRPPSSGRREWDPRATHARGGASLGAELSKNFAV